MSPSPDLRAAVLTASFGRHSHAPREAARELGLELVSRHEGHPKSAADAASAIGDAQAAIVGVDRIDASVFAACPGLRVVAKHGVGVDNIDLTAAEAAGVAVVNAPGANAEAVADLTLGLLLAGTRRILDADASVRAGEWGVFFGAELKGKTLGILGFGRIGRGVAARARGFGVSVLAYDPFVPDEAIAEAGAHPESLGEVVARSDFLSLHLPLPADGRPLLDADLIATMPAGAGLINAARGGLVDEPALAEALRAGSLSFAALDAFSTEPPPSDHPLLAAPNVIVTPHIGAYTDGANAAMGVTAVRDVVRVLRGEQPINPVRA